MEADNKRLREEAKVRKAARAKAKFLRIRGTGRGGLSHDSKSFGQKSVAALHAWLTDHAAHAHTRAQVSKRVGDAHPACSSGLVQMYGHVWACMHAVCVAAGEVRQFNNNRKS